MESEQSIPVPKKPVEQAEQEGHPLIHTYSDDMAQAMNATDATVVQEMLTDARDRETTAIQEIEEQKERKWYSISALIFIFLTLAVIGAGIYYYKHLTVPVQPAASVGAFPGTNTIVASSTTIGGLLSTLSTDTTVAQGRPTLVNLVTDAAQGSELLSNAQLYTFIGARVPEPLQATISVARLGVLSTDGTIAPFLIMSVPNPESASKELSIAEPTLLQLFGPALNIDMAALQNQVDQNFQSHYFYNLPVRTLSTAPNTATPQQLIFLYGYANNNTLVITADPKVLKAVYDSLINQQ